MPPRNADEKLYDRGSSVPNDWYDPENAQPIKYDKPKLALVVNNGRSRFTE